MRPVHTVGIDSGYDGGIADLSAQGELLGLSRIPLARVGGKRRIDWTKLTAYLAEPHRRDAHFIIEAVSGGMKMHSQSITVANYGGFLAAAWMAGHREIATVYSQTWQSKFGLKAKPYRPAKGDPEETAEEKAARKVEANRLKKLLTQALTESIWPGVAGVFGDAWGPGTWEAALIGKYGQDALFSSSPLRQSASAR